MTRKILKYPHPILTQPCDTIFAFADVVDEVIRDLRDTMSEVKWGRALGLAAPQIGYSLAICIARKTVMVNPKIILASPTTYEAKEGCYSLTEGRYDYPATRHRFIIVEYCRPNGTKTKARFSGFEAQIVQHEIDHIQGKLCYKVK